MTVTDSVQPRVDDEGWLTTARAVRSPNFNHRPEGERVSLLVIHNISLPPGEFGGQQVEHFFCNRLDPSLHPFFAEIADMQVSSHLYIRRDGEVVQFVSCDERAWHAGRSRFGDRTACNDFSIGIEMEGTDRIPYTDDQYNALIDVTRALRKRYPAITPDRIVGHEHIAPDRKSDPGPAFDWARYKAALGVDMDQQGETIR